MVENKSRRLPVVRDKLKRGGVSGEETGNAILVRKHDSCTVLGNSLITSPLISMTGPWCPGKFMVMDNEIFLCNLHKQRSLTTEMEHDVGKIGYLNSSQNCNVFAF